MFAPPPPVIHAPRAAHIVATPSGRRLAVAIPLTHAASIAPAGAWVHTRVTVVARMASGRRLTAAPSVLDHQHTGTASRREHHVFFSARQTTVLRGATRRVALRVTAAQAVDADGDGTLDPAPATTTTVTSLPAITAPTANETGDLQHAKGANPCAYYYPGSEDNCQVVAGATWQAQGFWQTNPWTPKCVQEVGTNFTATGKTTVVTSSDRYTVVSVPVDDTTYINIGDDNLTGHPYAYTPYTACLDGPGG
jgi:hypothetical protein